MGIEDGFTPRLHRHRLSAAFRRVMLQKNISVVGEWFDFRPANSGACHTPK
jgi:hypothetical protein